MKQVIVFLTIIFSTLSLSAQDKDIRTETYKVEGNCNMCKKRIEEAAFIKGVKRAEWNADKQQLTIVYKPSKTNADEVLTSVANAGYSSEKMVATEAAYKKLPECCHYKTETCNH